LTYTPVFAGLAAALCWGTADYMSRRQSEKVGAYTTVVYSHLVTLVVLIALVPILSPNLVLTPAPVVVLLVAGGLNFIAFIFLYRAFHRGVVSVVAPVAYTYPAVTTVLSILILRTFLSTVQLVAITGIILGVVLLSTRFSELRSFLGGKGAPNMTAGIGSAIGSSVFFGAVYIGVGYAAPLVSFVLPALLLRTVGTGAGFLLAPAFHANLRPSRLNLSNTILAMGVLEAAGFLSFTFGVFMSQGSLPIVAALSGMGGGIAAGYAMVFLKERLELNQVLGILLSIVGVFTLLYLGGA
jgi:drug/metabolite transporter (DMT)-like permease